MDSYVDIVLYLFGDSVLLMNTMATAAATHYLYHCWHRTSGHHDHVAAIHRGFRHTIKLPSDDQWW